MDLMMKSYNQNYRSQRIHHTYPDNKTQSTCPCNKIPYTYTDKTVQLYGYTYVYTVYIYA